MELTEKDYEYGVCPKCGRDLRLEYVEDIDETCECRMVCDHCGTWVNFWECYKDGQSDYDFYNEESAGPSATSYGYDAICPHCGSYCVWQNDFMYSDIYDENVSEEDDRLIAELLCPHCGGMVEIIYANNVPDEETEVEKE